MPCSLADEPDVAAVDTTWGDMHDWVTLGMPTEPRPD